jgi:hypothetical protein
MMEQTNIKKRKKNYENKYKEKDVALPSKLFLAWCPYLSFSSP